MACHVLKEVDYVVLVDKRHFAVNLCELWLAVGTKVFVAEALGYLEVAVESAHHEQLLQSLRALWQSVELTWVHARRHNEVACALRCRTDKYRSLNLDEVLCIEEVAYEDCHAVAQLQILAHGRTAQVEVAVLHTDVVAAVGVVLDSERRCCALRKDVQFGSDDFNVAGRKVGVLAFALVHNACHLNAVFASELACTCAKLAVVRVVEDKLCDAIAVAQVNKCHSAHLSNALYPSGKRYGLAGIGETQLSTSVCSIHIYYSVFILFR